MSIMEDRISFDEAHKVVVHNIDDEIKTLISKLQTLEGEFIELVKEASMLLQEYQKINEEYAMALSPYLNSINSSLSIIQMQITPHLQEICRILRY